MKAIDILKQAIKLQDIVQGVVTITPNESVSEFVFRCFGKTDYKPNSATFDSMIDFYYIYDKPIEGVCDIECEDEEGCKIYLYMIGEF